MTLTIKPVFTDNFHQTWPLIENFFKTVLKVDAEEYTIDQIKGLLSQGIWLLLVAVDEQNEIHGVGTVEFTNKFNDRVAFITTLAGKGIVNENVYKQMCAIAKLNGATKVRCAARESTARLYKQLGMKERHIILEATL